MKQIWIAIFLFLAIISPLQAKVYVVSVGIADYPGTKNDLRVSDNDAMTIAKVFNATQDAFVKVLVNEQATQSALLSTMHTVFAEAQSGDAILLYFSGHGTPGALVCHDGLLTYQHLFKMLNGCKASRKVIMADACYSGKMRTGKQQSASYNAQNVMLFLSSRTNETSQENPWADNGFFTQYLLKGIKGAADTNADRIITAKEIFTYVSTNVVDRTNGKQHPVMWGKFNDNMRVMNWNAKK